MTCDYVWQARRWADQAATVTVPAAIVSQERCQLVAAADRLCQGAARLASPHRAMLLLLTLQRAALLRQRAGVAAWTQASAARRPAVRVLLYLMRGWPPWGRLAPTARAACLP